MRSPISLAITLLAACALTAQSPLVYSNGPLITGPHPAGPGIGDSRLQSGAPPAGLNLNVLGFGAQQGAGNAIADDFSVGAPLIIDGIEVFGYLTGGATSPSPVTGVFVTISSTDPTVAITPVPGSPLLTTNSIATTTHGWSNIYRTTTTTPAVVNRPIMSMRVNVTPPITIATPGVYWLVYQFAGVNFAPPVSVLGVASTGGALQRLGAAGAFVPMVDTGNPVQPLPFQVNMPFNLYGQPTTPVGAITLTSPGCGGTTIRVGGAPVPGGVLRTDITASNPGIGLVLLGYGFTGVPFPFCGCVRGHDWSIIGLATSGQIDVPQDPSFYGLAFYTQGAELDGIGGCPAPAVTFTDTYKFQM